MAYGDKLPLQPTVLGEADTPWLHELTNEPLTDRWFAMANDVVQAGTAGSYQAALPAQILWARSRLYEDLLQFSSPDSPMYKAYLRFARKRPRLAPTNTFVDSMRAVHSRAIDTLRTSQSYPELWTYGGSVVVAKIDALAQETDASRDIIEGNARVLKYCDYPQKIRWWLDRGLEFAWPQTVTEQVPQRKPLSLTAPQPRLALHALYLQRFGKPTFTAARVAGLLMEHPDRHLVALAETIPDYTYAFIRKATIHLLQDQRDTRVREILTDPASDSLFGPDIITAHRQYFNQMRPDPLVA